jgi:hypothetical protein
MFHLAKHGHQNTLKLRNQRTTFISLYLFVWRTKMPVEQQLANALVHLGGLRLLPELAALVCAYADCYELVRTPTSEASLLAWLAFCGRRNRAVLDHVARHHTRLSPAFLARFAHALDPRLLCRWQQALPEPWLTQHADELDWSVVCTWQRLSTDFIRQHQARVDWLCVCRFQTHLGEADLLALVPRRSWLPVQYWKLYMSPSQWRDRRLSLVWLLQRGQLGRRHDVDDIRRLAVLTDFYD